MSAAEQKSCTVIDARARQGPKETMTPAELYGKSSSLQQEHADRNWSELSGEERSKVATVHAASLSRKRKFVPPRPIAADDGGSDSEVSMQKAQKTGRSAVRNLSKALSDMQRAPDAGGGRGMAAVTVMMTTLPHAASTSAVGGRPSIRAASDGEDGPERRYFIIGPEDAISLLREAGAASKIGRVQYLDPDETAGQVFADVEKPVPTSLGMEEVVSNLDVASSSDAAVPLP